MSIYRFFLKDRVEVHRDGREHSTHHKNRVHFIRRINNVVGIPNTAREVGFFRIRPIRMLGMLRTEYVICHIDSISGEHQRGTNKADWNIMDLKEREIGDGNDER